jgi:hypothetical protein
MFSALTIRKKFESSGIELQQSLTCILVYQLLNWKQVKLPHDQSQLRPHLPMRPTWIGHLLSEKPPSLD